MSFAYGHIAERVFNRPLLYDGRKAEAFMLGLGGRISGAPIVIQNGGQAADHATRPMAGRLGDFVSRVRSLNRGEVLYVENNVAIIPIEGSLVHKGSWIGESSGITSYEGIMAQLTYARSEHVKGVVLEVDSFGGETNGCAETAAMIAALAKIKPVIAILSDFAYSAGYWLASQARVIVAPEFGGAGSIGTILLHADYSKQMAADGITVTIIRAGEKKAEGNPFEPLADSQAQKWQTQAEEIRVRFAEAVAKGRGSRFSKAKALKTEAEAFDAKEALSLGLIDAIVSPSQAFEAFVREVNKV